MAGDTAMTGNKEDWGGGAKPFKASYGKLMMWYFLVSDAFTFAGFLIAYGSLRFSTPAWPVPDFVFSSLPGGIHGAPLIFVTIMTFVLLFSSYTMVRAVGEGHRENKNGVVFWMLLTVIGGAGFLGCQAWEWKTLIGAENMTVTTNPFGTHLEDGTYMMANGKISTHEDDAFNKGESYLLHKAHVGHDDHHGDHADHGDDGHEMKASDIFLADANKMIESSNVDLKHLPEQGINYPGFLLDGKGFIHRKTATGEDQTVGVEQFGPKAFGALFFFITGFHGFHVLSGVVFLLIILLNVMSGLYAKRKNGYEMVEKIGLYWHFVDLVWVFVFLVFYLI